jgi:hypothetical protein
VVWCEEGGEDGTRFVPRRRLRGAGATFLRRPTMALCRVRRDVVSAPTTMSQQQVIHAYRHLYRHSLRAIHFSKPARYTLRDRLRLAFRRGSASDFEPQKVHNTLEFLQYATRENGLEHKIVKNLLFVWWVQSQGGHGRHKAKILYVPVPRSEPNTVRLTCQTPR